MTLGGMEYLPTCSIIVLVKSGIKHRMPTIDYRAGWPSGRIARDWRGRKAGTAMAAPAHLSADCYLRAGSVFFSGVCAGFGSPTGLSEPGVAGADLVVS